MLAVIGFRALATQLDMVLQAWPGTKGYHPIFIEVFPWETFYHIPEKDDYNLTPLPVPRVKINYTFDNTKPFHQSIFSDFLPQNLSQSSEIITMIKKRLEKGEQNNSKINGGNDESK